MTSSDRHVSDNPEVGCYVEANGHKHHYIDRTPTGKYPLILLHGFAMHARVWDTFANSVGTDYRPIAVDFRGHGDSDWSPELRYDRATMVSDIADFVPKVTGADPFIVGHSMGGAIALLLAASGKKDVQPRAVVMIDSALAKPKSPREIGNFLDQSPTGFSSLDDMVDYAARLARGRSREDLQRSVLRNARQLADGRWSWKYDPELILSRQRSGPESYETLWSALESLTVPLLYIKASHKSHLGAKEANRLESVNPLVQLVTVPESTHAVMRDNPVAFYTLVMQFLTTVSV